MRRLPASHLMLHPDPPPPPFPPQVRHPSARVEHEASTSKIGEDQLFYFQQRGVDMEDAVRGELDACALASQRLVRLIHEHWLPRQEVEAVRNELRLAEQAVATERCAREALTSSSVDAALHLACLDELQHTRDEASSPCEAQAHFLPLPCRPLSATLSCRFARWNHLDGADLACLILWQLEQTREELKLAISAAAGEVQGEVGGRTVGGSLSWLKSGLRRMVPQQALDHAQAMVRSHELKLQELTDQCREAAGRAAAGARPPSRCRRSRRRRRRRPRA